MTTGEARSAWLRLAALPVSARRRSRLLDSFGSPEALFEASGEQWRQAGLDDGLQSQLRTAGRLDVRRDLDRLDSLDVDLVVRDDPRYPLQLAAIDDPPVLLFVRGRLPDLNQPCVALVGTRRVNAYGSLVAEQLGRELAGLGIGVISGLAAGIDSAAHKGALRAGDGGYTAGVLGTGVDRIFPASHVELAEQVAARGGLISEFRLGESPLAWHFPLRNRIISGLSRAVVVVQAPLRSGALITARLATEQGREVLAVPGLITDARQEGCHALIRDGAGLVRDVDDILASLNLRRAEEGDTLDFGGPPPAPAPAVKLSDDEQRVIETLGLTPVCVDDVIEGSRLSTPEVQSALVTLELAGLVVRLPGNRFVRAT
ncbi:MAG: DNA-protecting protein DprA [Armatimonadetes bacterium]|nr:DNA-protecting protein DprA [Armatimonadota bacterium]